LGYLICIQCANCDCFYDFPNAVNFLFDVPVVSHVITIPKYAASRSAGAGAVINDEDGRLVVEANILDCGPINPSGSAVPINLGDFHPYFQWQGAPIFEFGRFNAQLVEKIGLFVGKYQRLLFFPDDFEIG
jgi:hypothetical protein